MRSEQVELKLHMAFTQGGLELYELRDENSVAVFALVRFEHNSFDAYMTWVHLLFVSRLCIDFLCRKYLVEICKRIQIFSTLLYWWSLSKPKCSFQCMHRAYFAVVMGSLSTLIHFRVYSINVRRTYGLCLCNYFARYSCGYHHHIEVPTQKSRHVHFHSVVTSSVDSCSSPFFVLLNSVPVTRSTTVQFKSHHVSRSVCVFFGRCSSRLLLNWF